MNMTDGCIHLVRVCPQCGKEYTIPVKTQSFLDYEMGAYLQDAFPYLEPAQRELIRGGICGSCWDKMFGPFPSADAE